jgi:hypothetical protein
MAIFGFRGDGTGFGIASCCRLTIEARLGQTDQREAQAATFTGLCRLLRRELERCNSMYWL